MKLQVYKGSKSTFENPYKRGNTAEWIQSGENYFVVLEKLIDSAVQEIHLQTYIFNSDETGKRIADALIRAADRKVRVYIVADAFGSNDLRQETISRFTKSGIHLHFFGRLFSKGRFHLGRRLHHKVTVIDGHTAIVGGINISNNYNSLNGNVPWLDFAALLKGNICSKLRLVCLKQWKGRKIPYADRPLFELIPVVIPVTGKSFVRVRRNDFSRRYFEISISYRESIRRAVSSLTMIGGYFLPGGRTRRLLKRAVERGVKISVIISEKSDVKVLVNARRYLYGWLLRNGIEVYEYLPANVHGKVLIVDDKWCSIGSYDLNNLSTYSNIELNVDIKDADFSGSLAMHVLSIRDSQCLKITPESYAKSLSVVSKIRNWFSYRLVKTLFVLSVLLAGKEKNK